MLMFSILKNIFTLVQICRFAQKRVFALINKHESQIIGATTNMTENL